MPQVTICGLDVLSEAAWDFRSGLPAWDHATFDPFPAYPHDRAVTEAAVALVTGRCPPLYDIRLYLADREETSRTNGYSHVREHGHWQGDGDARQRVRDPAEGVIVLAGKRIPPHPAVTRYLVGHEYGHHVEYMLNMARGAQYLTSEDTAEEYRQARNLRAGQPRHGTGGAWHEAVAEILACDFRVLVCGIEPEMWPHPGIPRPEEVPGLARWWDGALARLSEDPAVPAGR